jgi:hypothetical protein
VPETDGTGFETEHMRALYRYGYEKAQAAALWEAKPPLIEPTDAPQVASR